MYDPPQIRGLQNGLTQQPSVPLGCIFTSAIRKTEDREQPTELTVSDKMGEQEPKELFVSSGCVRLATRNQDSQCLPHPFFPCTLSLYFFLISFKAVIVY